MSGQVPQLANNRKATAFAANLNVDPPETDAAVPSTCHPPRDSDAAEIEARRLTKLGKSRSRNLKVECPVDYGADPDATLPGQLVSSSSSREEKVSSLKTGLVHVARKMPKNAHAHFVLGLMYQRLGQPSKAVLAYEKAEEILRRPEVDVDRTELLSLVQIHHAQCIMLESAVDGSSDKELEPWELEEILSKLKESMQSDVRQAAVWNTLGLILLKTGRLQSAISVLSSLLAVAHTSYDCLANLGIAYLQSGNLDLSEKCFQELILKDQNHPTALINYAALLLCRYGSVVAGAGANAGGGASADHVSAINVAKECLLASLNEDPKAGHIWANLANAYYMTGDHRSSSKCLEKAAKLELNCMSTRYAVAVHRTKDAERYQDPSEQLSWAGNEMASVIRDGDSVSVELPIAWAGLAMVHKAQHEISAAFDTEQNALTEVEEHANYSLKQEVRMPAAGSKGAPKRPGELKDDTNASREEKQIIMRALSNPPFGDYRVWWSLSDSKYAGTALIVKKCFQPQKIFFNLDKKALKHEPDGRVILAEFETFQLLNTYAPNNGWKEEENSFPRRRKWDKRILEFVLQCSDKPLIWCGDLNVSHEEIDVTHPDFFSAAKVNGYVPPNKEDCGQPGFTLSERKQFGNILKEGKLIDAYRFLHKEKDMEHGFSWSGNPIGKYIGKRMRIDYFVVAEQLKDRIVSCEMHGQGIELRGFYGSDHCPVTLVLSEAQPNSKESDLTS